MFFLLLSYVKLSTRTVSSLLLCGAERDLDPVPRRHLVRDPELPGLLRVRLHAPPQGELRPVPGGSKMGTEENIMAMNNSWQSGLRWHNHLKFKINPRRSGKC